MTHHWVHTVLYIVLFLYININGLSSKCHAFNSACVYCTYSEFISLNSEDREDLSANGEKTNKTIETWGRKWRGINQGQWGTLIIYRFLIPLNTN